MLLRGSSTRSARGSTPNRSSNRSRGQGSTSRGASSFSSPSSNSPNPFEQERIENAAKRMHRGQNGTMVNGRGGRGTSRGGQNGKQVRFADPPAEPKSDPFAGAKSSEAINPFAPKPMASSSPFGSPKISPFNPFAPLSNTNTQLNPFGAPSTMANPFGAPSQPFVSQPTPSVFGTTSGVTFGTKTPKSSDNPSLSVFGAPSAPISNLSMPKTNGISAPSSTFKPLNTFGTPSSGIFSGKSATSTSISPSVFGNPSTSNSAGITKSPFGSDNASNARLNTNSPFSKPAQNGGFPKPSASQHFQPEVQSTSRKVANGISGTLAEKIEQLLRKERIFPPSWPALDSQAGIKYNDPAMIKLHNDYKAYRAKVRTALIRGGVLDDPDKPKKLSEALEFKGTCEDMCPDFERASRIMDLRIDPNEREGNLPSQSKMVKALARSAAGQDAPLPSDIRTAAALRRTVDHLFQDVLNHRALPDVHGFLWDRTRAIRRDFVFHSSMTPPELVDQVYCLEHITRFHVIALHQMSKENLSVDKFSEQQELEQLGKTLLSLIHAYEDCNAQRVACENEAEFRAYYVLFNSLDPGILETVQNWGWKYWGESEDIKVAVSLVEALQNTWELHGPLKPHSATNIAQNGFSRFFTIIEDQKISYTLACFAEIFFNDVRKSVLKTLLGSYRKQRDQTKDWTLSKLNIYLRFDEEEDIVPFVEAHGLRIDEVDGEEYLSFDVTEVSDPWPKLKQTHSYNIVERKRGNHSLAAVIDRTVFDESAPEDHVNEEEEGLFVKDDSIPAQALPEPVAVPNIESQQPENESEVVPNNTADQSTPMQENDEKPESILKRMGTHTTFSNGFFTPRTYENSAAAQTGSAKMKTSSIFGNKTATETASSTVSPETSTPFFFSPQPAQETQPIFWQPPKESASSSPLQNFSFPKQPTAEPTQGNTTSPLSIDNHSVASGSLLDINASFSPNPQSTTTSSPQLMANTQWTKNEEPRSPFEPLSRPSTFFSTPQIPTSTSSPNKIMSQSSPKTDTGEAARVLSTETSLGNSTVSESKPLSGVKPPAPIDRSKQFEGLASWIALGEDGLLDQFIAFHVEEILRPTTTMFIEEEAARAAQEADDLARMEADQFRHRSLAIKYGYRWRELAHRLWLKRKGREARQARRDMAESIRASKVAQLANVVEDFKASTTVRRRDSLESLLDATGVLNGVHDPNDEIRLIAREKLPGSSHKRQRSERPSTSIVSSTNHHKRGKSDNPLRRSLLSDPSYLNGGSRIHLMSNYGAQEEGRRQVSGVQTDYFRLKARGITTLPDGTPLANSAARSIVHRKRSLDGIQKTSTPQSSKHQTVPTSVPAKFSTHVQALAGDNEREDLEALKIKAKSLISEEKKSRQKRTFADDDEELFERAKRIREQMDEGAKWYRKEIERDTASRSVS